MNKKENSSFSDPFEEVFNLMGIIVIIMIIIIGVLFYVSYNESSKACDSFEGKLSGSMNCIKNGVSYEIETKCPFCFKMQVVRKAVNIDYAKGEVSA